MLLGREDQEVQWFYYTKGWLKMDGPYCGCPGQESVFGSFYRVLIYGGSGIDWGQ